MKQVTLKCIDFYKCIIFILAAWYSVPISFFSVRCLRNHLKTVHLEEKPFRCKFCNCQTSFASEGRLTTHVIRVHSKKMVRLTRFIYNLRIITGKSRLLRFIPILAYIKSSLYHLSTLLFFRILNWYAGVSNSVVFHFDSILKKKVSKHSPEHFPPKEKIFGGRIWYLFWRLESTLKLLWD